MITSEISHDTATNIINLCLDDIKKISGGLLLTKYDIQFTSTFEHVSGTVSYFLSGRTRDITLLLLNI